ncbi:MAG TPA: lysylphosphatidylglycerol synthase transmembrane domain-containing protein [Anaerolineales bacterium]|nr:lysylphosphatidylglycerol synthase transmembrane domain-containing protein [Anaerolineales bacterium]
MRKLIFIIVIFLGATLIFLSFSELESIVDTLQQGSMRFIVLALMFQIAWFMIAGLGYKSLYNILGLKESFSKLMLLYASANFVNTIAPTGGAGGMAVFISAATRDGHSVGKVTVASMLYLFVDYVAFLVVLTLGLIVLFRRNDLGPTQIGTSAVLFAAATLLGFLLFLGSQSGKALGNVLAWMARLVNRVARPFIHREYLSEARAHEFAEEMAADLKSLPKRPLSLLVPFWFSLAGKALLMLVMTCVFLAFDIPFSAGTIIAGFAISYLFLIVSPTPAGIGIVEGVMPLALSSLRVPWSQALIVTLAYRGITFWIPLGLGAIAFRMTEGSNKQVVPPQYPES